MAPEDGDPKDKEDDEEFHDAMGGQSESDPVEKLPAESQAVDAAPEEDDEDGDEEEGEAPAAKEEETPAGVEEDQEDDGGDEEDDGGDEEVTPVPEEKLAEVAVEKEEEIPAAS